MVNFRDKELFGFRFAKVKGIATQHCSCNATKVGSILTLVFYLFTWYFEFYF